MIHTSTITKKGQITIPKQIRESFDLKEGEKVFIEISNEEIKIKPRPDIFELAGKFKPRKVKDAVKIRETMMKRYGIG